MGSETKYETATGSEKAKTRAELFSVVVVLYKVIVFCKM